MRRSLGFTRSFVPSDFFKDKVLGPFLLLTHSASCPPPFFLIKILFFRVVSGPQQN